MLLEVTLWSITALFGGVLCIQDFREQKVGVLPLAGFVVSCLLVWHFLTHTFCIAPLIIFLLMGIAFWGVRKKRAFGLADYIVVFAISFVISPGGWYRFTALCGLFGIAVSIICRRRKFPFIPAIICAAMAELFIAAME
ncbi:MAG: hypothetical protein IJ599_02695 [Alphaproteobacteria bacterium]|nr:hypothetical protein [Alphaproteobacteria bacterium]